MEVKKLTPAELEGLLPLVWDVFLEYEGVQYPEDGKRAFWNAIHGPAYLSALRAYGAFDGGEVLGVIHRRPRRGPPCGPVFRKGCLPWPQHRQTAVERPFGGQRGRCRHRPLLPVRRAGL